MPYYPLQSSVHPFRFAAKDGMLYHFLAPDSFAVAVEGRTGRVARVYRQGLTLTNYIMIPGGTKIYNAELMPANGKLAQIDGNRLVVLDEQSGARLWDYTGPDSLLLNRLVVSTAENRLFCFEDSVTATQTSRWPGAPCVNALCFDLSDGTMIWRTRVPDRCWAAEVSYSNGYVVMNTPQGIGSSSKLLNVTVLRASDGTVAWTRSFYNTWDLQSIVRNDTVYVTGPFDLFASDMRTGAIDTMNTRDGVRPQRLLTLGYNAGCTRSSASQDYLILGAVSYYDRDYNWVYSGITRGPCASGGVPSYGMTYFGSSSCACMGKQLSGWEALRFEYPLPPVDDGRRLQTGPLLPPAMTATQTFAGSDLLTADWDTLWTNAFGCNAEREYYWADGTGAQPVTNRPLGGSTALIGGLTYKIAINEHRIECYNGATLKWSFVAGGRINQLPLVANGLALFGSHDGYVYAVRTTDGVCQWRFMAAPAEKKMMAYGQLESCWPVFGVEMAGNVLCFSAGRHPEIDGGIAAYGIEPATGALLWSKVVRADVMVYPQSVKPSRKRNAYVNGDSLSDIGIDPANPQNVMVSNTTDGGGTPLVDLPHVRIARPYGSTDNGTRSRDLAIRIDGYSGSGLVFRVQSRGAHTIAITTLNGRTVFHDRSSGSAVYTITRRHLPPGRYAVLVRDPRSQTSMSVRVVY